MHVFDLIGIHVGCGGLNSGGQVIDNFFLGCRLVQGGHRVANLKREVGFGGAEDLRGIFVQPVRLWVLGHAVHHALRAFDGNLFNLLAVHVEDDAAKPRCASVIKVNHGALGASGGFDRALN